VWLSPAFRDWNIEAEIAHEPLPRARGAGRGRRITARSSKIRAIARRLPKTRLFAIPRCGHSPHRDQPELLIREAGRFILEHPST
jgi:pimeloyl-ACP methyl ester carboxylesterase